MPVQHTSERLASNKESPEKLWRPREQNEKSTPPKILNRKEAPLEAQEHDKLGKDSEAKPLSNGNHEANWGRPGPRVQDKGHFGATRELRAWGCRLRGSAGHPAL